MFQWAPLYHPAVYIVAALAVLALLYLAWWSAASRSLRNVWFFVPRVLVIAAVLFVLLNPVQETTKQLPPRRPRVSCLIDTSQSMGLDLPTSRLESAKRFVFDSQEELDFSNSAKLQLYQFGSQLSSVPSVADLTASDGKSDLGEALSTLDGIFQEPPKAVVVVSDGQVSGRAQLEKLASNFKARGIPVHVLPVGDTAIRGDIAIERLSVPKNVKARDLAPVRVAIRSQGFDGQRVELQVRPSTSPDSQPIATLPVTLRGGTQTHDVVVPADPNAGELTVSVPVAPREAIESNNAVPFELLARNRKIKVFYMEGTQGSEYRYIRDALQDDPSITCVAAVVDNQYVARPRLARVDDPYRGFPATRKELFEYDVVICSDISKGAFTREQLDWTAELVRDRGGGFVMIGGYTSFGAGNWDQTVWDQLIPIDMRGDQIGQGVVNQPFQVRVPASVRTHPIWRISDDTVENDRIIDSMPRFYGTNLAKRLKPAAILLGESQGNVAGLGKTMVFACHAYGRGRTFAMLPDSTVSWGSDFERHWGEGDNRHFRKFWRNTVNWLTENSISAQRRLLVDTDRLIYRPGESIDLVVTALDDNFQPTTNVDVEVRCLDHQDTILRSTTLRPSADRFTGEAEAFLPPNEPAEASTLKRLHIQIRATRGGEEIAVRDLDIQVLNDSDELKTPNADQSTLQELAAWTGGKVLEYPEDLVDALGDVESTPGDKVVYRTPVWDSPLLWLTLLSLITGEWLIRRFSTFSW